MGAFFLVLSLFNVFMCWSQSLCPMSSAPIIITGTSIAEYAYESCGTITSVEVPSTVFTCGSFAFSNCYSLTQVTLINGLTVVGHNMFSIYNHRNPTLLTTIVIPSTITSIGENAFAYITSLSQVTLNNGLTVMGYGMFYMDGVSSLLKTMLIPSTVTKIGSKAFYTSSFLSQVTLVEGLTVIGQEMFFMKYGKPTLLTTIVIPSTVTKIGSNAFQYCSSLSQVTLTNGLTMIGDSMFDMGANPTRLTTMVIPSTITSIGSGAFAYISSLVCIYWLGPIITSPADIFYGSSSAKACSFSPTAITSKTPTGIPNLSPTGFPTLSPTGPSLTPTGIPTFANSKLPTHQPSTQAPSFERNYQIADENLSCESSFSYSLELDTIVGVWYNSIDKSLYRFNNDNTYEANEVNGIYDFLSKNVIAMNGNLHKYLFIGKSTLLLTDTEKSITTLQKQ